MRGPTDAAIVGAAGFGAASTPLTLRITPGVAPTFVPVVLAYQLWVHRTTRQPVTPAGLEGTEAY